MKEKRLDYEVLRIIAIFLVVFNHSQHRGFELYLVEGGSFVNNFISLALAVLCKIAVPLFLMISGGLLLHREESIKTVILKRVLRMIAALVLFSGVLYLFWIRWGTVETPGVRDFLLQLWSTGISEPYWYLYAYTALMLMLPVLRPMVRGMSNSTFVYLMLLHVLYQVVSGPVGFLVGAGSLYEKFNLPLVEGTLFYFIMGYYFGHRFSWSDVRKRAVGFMAIVSVGAIGIMMALTWSDLVKNGESTQFFMESLLCFPVFTVYGAVCVFFRNRRVSPGMSRFIAGLGGCVFGTYLLEGILRRELLFLYDYLEPRLHVLPACFLWILAVVISGCVITWILKKVPILRKLL